MEKFAKSDSEIKAQIINWFFTYQNKPTDSFTGQEQFTLFDKLSSDQQMQLTTILNSSEIPVLILKSDKDTKILCTTRRFIHIENSKVEELKYTDFNCHVGYKSIATPGHSGPTIGVKTDGYVAEFGLQKNNGQVIYWRIPTGHSGYAFWNVTKKFDLIGRKYIVD